MSKKEYVWEVGQPPPELHVHSLAKHEVLRAYLSRYLEVLTTTPRMDRFRLTLVDGFSGGGVYLHEDTRREVSGSPLIFLEATQEAVKEINMRKAKKFTLDAHYFFIEQKRQTLEFLRNTLLNRGYGELLRQDRIQLLAGGFSDKVSGIIDFVRKKGRAGRTIFLLDQYGYKDVPFPILRQIFSSLPGAEIILTFAVDALGDFLTDSPESELILSNMGLAGRVDLKSIAGAKGASDRRFFIQKIFSPFFQKDSGAHFYTPFFITSRESNRDYWLVHLSMHARARDEMAKLHWSLKNHFRHNGGAGFNMLGYDPKKDESLTGQPDFDFDEKASQRSIQSLRNDIPDYLTPRVDGIHFQQLIAETCNMTPASSDLYKDVLGELLVDKSVIITSKEGGQRRKGDSIQKTDLIKIPRQASFFFRKKA